MPEIYADPNIYKTLSDGERKGFQSALREHRERQDFSDFPEQLRELIASTEKEKPGFLQLFFSRTNERMLEFIRSLGIECQSASLDQIHVIPRSTMRAISEKGTRGRSPIERGFAIRQLIAAVKLILALE
ncbi:MAG: hypothetical protein WCT32_00030 [Patescibacteria group bacterium]|jgi:hypothetical protein